MKNIPLKTKVMTIVHGQSEYRICCSLKSNLRIKHEIIAEKKGKKSIQINGLMKILEDSRFRSFDAFVKCFVDVEHKRKKLINFRLFIIMDVDDCTKEKKNRYLSKEMFSKHWMYDYIVPIYNEPDLEKTMEKAKIPIMKKQDYILIFPTNKGDLDVKIAREFLDTLRDCECSNLDKYVEYCLSLVTRF